jgi:hypothetical protein
MTYDYMVRMLKETGWTHAEIKHCGGSSSRGSEARRCGRSRRVRSRPTACGALACSWEGTKTRLQSLRSRKCLPTLVGSTAATCGWTFGRAAATPIGGARGRGPQTPFDRGRGRPVERCPVTTLPRSFDSGWAWPAAAARSKV